MYLKSDSISSKEDTLHLPTYVEVNMAIYDKY